MLNRCQVWRGGNILRSGMREKAKTFTTINRKIKILLAFLSRTAAANQGMHLCCLRAVSARHFALRNGIPNIAKTRIGNLLMEIREIICLIDIAEITEREGQIAALFCVSHLIFQATFGQRHRQIAKHPACGIQLGVNPLRATGVKAERVL
ncbi:hypothetical protein D3C80_1277730 [compost metagenome]